MKEEYSNRVAYRYIVDDMIVDKTYAELAKDAKSIASWLVQEGYYRRHIAIIGATSYQWITAFLGITGSANVVVPVDRMLSEKEMMNILEMGDVELVFVSEEFEHLLKTFEQKEKLKMRVIRFSGECFQEILHTIPAILPLIESEGLAEILFTSGTTGVSKGVMLSHTNITANIKEYYRMNILENIHCEPVAMSVLPIHHTYELTIGHLGMLYRGITICINDKLENIVLNLNRFKPAIILVVPTIIEAFYKKIMESISSGKNKRKMVIAKRINRILKVFKIDISRKLYKSLLNKFGGNLTSIVVGGAALRIEVAKAFEEFGVNIYQGYGLTECAPLVSSNCPKENRLGSVGKPIACMSVKIEQGDILTKGDCVMLGYYKNPEATAEVITEDGWFRTGDLGYLDEDGYLYITGRSKNLIILSNGKNIYPEELESQLMTIDGVKDVMVYERDGKICAAVHPVDISDTQGINDIRTELNKINTSLPTYKKIVAIDFIAREFPKTTTLKIKRKEAMQLIDNTIQKNALEYIPPSTAIQKKIVEAFEEVLGRTRIGIRDDFFDMGGESLTAVEAALILGVQVQDIYTSPTAEMLEYHLVSKEEKMFIENNCDEVNELIQHNSNLDYDAEMKCVLLTGATGFLGSHILRELTKHNITIVCLVRDYYKLKRVLENYFPKEYTGFTYSVVEGDIEKGKFGLSDEVYKTLVNRIDMVIHTAANVSHAGHYEDFERTNVMGTQNVIEFCKEANAILQHTSTASVSGSGTVEQGYPDAVFDEFSLNIGQKYTQNVYIHSKYKAEELVLLARKEGLRANIFRIGNLTWRVSDGKFQINAKDNGFVKRCRGLLKIGLYGEALAEYLIDFTPVDECADAYVKLCFNKKVNNIYHLYNPHTYTLKAFSRRLLYRIKKTEQAVFEKKLKEWKGDADVAVLAFYNSIATLSRNIPTSNIFTVSVLQKLGFKWSKVGLRYLLIYDWKK
ncbi:MAG: AMP-binding protein [Lachnospiraceae bacterium]|nr:AMP-binding protein [Lachnospiraceae bacterium]